MLDPAGIRIREALGLSSHFFARFLVGVEAFGVIGFMLNGLFIFWRRSLRFPLLIRDKRKI